MTWPLTPVSTANLDAGSDEPRLARVELKQAVDNLNSIASEFGNVDISTATNDQILVKSGNVWSGTNTITNLDKLDFDTAAAQTATEGQIVWDAGQGTAAIGLANNVLGRLTQDMTANVTNAESVTINKGQPVYHFGAQGDRASVKLAYNTSDATSAKTFGIAAENIAAGQTGMIITQGILEGLNLSAYAAGDTLYLGATAGAVTNVKPKAPNHLVYLGTISRSNAGSSILYVKIQNGYELDEIHDANITSPVTGQVLQYSGNVWVNANVALDNLSDVAITSPTTNQILQYNGTQWVNATVSTGSSSYPTQILKMDAVGVTCQSAYTQVDTGFSVIHAGNASVTTSGNLMVFPSGTYLMEFDNSITAQTSSSTTTGTFQVRFQTVSGNIALSTVFAGVASGNDSGRIYYQIFAQPIKFTTTTTENIKIEVRDSSSNGGSLYFNTGIIRITKVA